MALQEPIPDIMTGAPAAPPRAAAGTPGGGLDALTISELLALRTQVEQKLPAKSLAGLNLEHELVLQVLALQQLQQRVITDEEIPPNQQSQVANSLSAALTNLVKLQESVFTSERLKKIEAMLIETLKTLPTEAQEAFLRAYEEGLTSL